MDVLAVLFLLFHILAWPVVNLFHAVVFLLSPFYTLGAFLLLPFIHLARVFVNIASFPFSVQWLERIETLYIYLGTATLIGGLTGGVLFAIFNFVSTSLIPEPSERKPSKPNKSEGRTVEEFKAARREKEVGMSPLKPPNSRRRGLLSQTIDEEDSDY